VSTKRLSRTVVEGGRASNNTYARRASRQKERVEARRICHDTRGLIDTDDQFKVAVAHPVSKHHDDKLGPAYRWLRSQLGQEWGKVRSRLYKRFDQKTLQGWHLVQQHLLQDVRPLLHSQIGNFWNSNYGFYIDEQGILRMHERNRWTRVREKNPPPKDLRPWLKNRLVLDMGHQQLWMVSTKITRQRCDNPRYCITPYNDHKKEKVRLFVRTGVQNNFWKTVVHEGELGFYDYPTFYFCEQLSDFRQGPPLTPEEKKFWFSLAPNVRDLHRFWTAAQSSEKWF
jgi:hypothetical protein